RYRHHDAHRVVGLVVDLLHHADDVSCASLFASELELNEIRGTGHADGAVDLPSATVVRSPVHDLKEIHEIVEPCLEVIASLLRAQSARQIVQFVAQRLQRLARSSHLLLHLPMPLSSCPLLCLALDLIVETA